MSTSPRAPRAPRASVLICARDEAAHIGRAITSILDQGHDDVEIVVVDDGSTDDTAEVAASFPGVRVVVNDRPGLVNALNRSVREARSELLVRLDADDWHLPGGIDALLAPLERDPTVALVGGCARQVDEAGTALYRHVTLPDTDHHRLLGMILCPLQHTACAYRRSDVLGVGGYRADGDIQVGEDNDLFLRLLDTDRRTVGVVADVAVHVLRPGSVTGRFGADSSDRGRRDRAEFRRRHGTQLCEFGRLRTLGRPLVRWSDPTGRSARFGYTLVRLAHLSLLDREYRRAGVIIAAAVSLGPHAVARGVVSELRGRIRRRRARGLRARSHVVGFVLGK